MGVGGAGSGTGELGTSISEDGSSGGAGAGVLGTLAQPARNAQAIIPEKIRRPSIMRKCRMEKSGREYIKPARTQRQSQVRR